MNNEISILTIYDELSEEYNTPIFGNIKTIERELIELIKQDKIPFYNDKKLYKLGTYNKTTGEIISHPKELIQNLSHYKIINKTN